MLNLLIREDRYKIRGEYLNRMFNIFLVATILGIAGFVSMLYVANYYIQVHTKILEEESSKVKALLDSEKYKTFITKSKHLKAEYNLLNRDRSKRASIIIETLFAHIYYGINIESINIIYREDEQGKIIDVSAEVRGISDSRDNLLAYIESIKVSPGVVDVEVPVANYIKNYNVPYHLRVVFKTEEKDENTNE